MKLSNPSRRLSLAAICLPRIVLLSALYAGCSRSLNDTKVGEPAEPSLAEQAAAVREGRSDQIRLDHTLVKDQDLPVLDGLNGKLRRINLSQTDLSDEGLARLSQFDKLEQLRLRCPKITDQGTWHLMDLKQIRHLHLIDAPITDTGLDHLHALMNLESLYLDGAQVTDDGIERLFEVFADIHLHVDGAHHHFDEYVHDHEP